MFRTTCSLALLCCALTGYFFTVSTPQALQKLYVIVADDPSHSRPGEIKGVPIDIAASLSNVPDYSDPRLTETGLHNEKKQGLRSGLENCSERVFAYAGKLSEYRIIHFLPVPDFVKGQGHTLIEVRGRTSNFGEGDFIVDVNAGALPLSHGRPVSLLDLLNAEFKGIQDVQFSGHNNQATVNRYPYHTMLAGSAVGYMDSNQIRRYLSIVDTVFFPLGDRRLERLLFNGLALIVGVYPNIHVTAAAATQMFQDHPKLQFDRWMAKLFVVSARMLLIAMTGWLIYGVARFLHFTGSWYPGGFGRASRAAVLREEESKSKCAD